MALNPDIVRILNVIHECDLVLNPDKKSLYTDLEQAWREVEVIIAQAPNEPHDFVTYMYNYLTNVRKKVYKSDASDLFALIVRGETSCNCLCSSNFLLMCAISRGFFPKQISGLHLGNPSRIGDQNSAHIAIVDDGRKNIFEATQRCPPIWDPLDRYLTLYHLYVTDNLIIVSTVSMMISDYVSNTALVATNNTNTNINNKEAVELLIKYNDHRDISAQVVLIYSINPCTQLFLSTVQLLVDLAQVYIVTASYQYIMTILKLNHLSKSGTLNPACIDFVDNTILTIVDLFAKYRTRYSIESNYSDITRIGMATADRERQRELAKFTGPGPQLDTIIPSFSQLSITQPPITQMTIPTIDYDMALDTENAMFNNNSLDKVDPYYNLIKINEAFWNALILEQPSNDPDLLFNTFTSALTPNFTPTNRRPLTKQSWSNIQRHLTKFKFLFQIMGSVLITGELLLRLLFGLSTGSDIDDKTNISFYNMISEDVNLIIKSLHKEFENRALPQVYVEEGYVRKQTHLDDLEFVRTSQSLTIKESITVYKQILTGFASHDSTILNGNYEINLRLYNSPTEILHTIDIDCCCIGYDGQDLWITPRGLHAWQQGYNVFNFKGWCEWSGSGEGRSGGGNGCEARLAKYGSMFGVKVLYFQRSRVNQSVLSTFLNGVDTRDIFNRELLERIVSLGGLGLLLVAEHYELSDEAFDQLIYITSGYKAHPTPLSRDITVYQYFNMVFYNPGPEVVSALPTLIDHLTRKDPKSSAGVDIKLKLQKLLTTLKKSVDDYQIVINTLLSSPSFQSTSSDSNFISISDNTKTKESSLYQTIWDTIIQVNVSLSPVIGMKFPKVTIQKLKVIVESIISLRFNNLITGLDSIVLVHLKDVYDLIYYSYRQYFVNSKLIMSIIDHMIRSSSVDETAIFKDVTADVKIIQDASDQIVEKGQDMTALANPELIKTYLTLLKPLTANLNINGIVGRVGSVGGVGDNLIHYVSTFSSLSYHEVLHIPDVIYDFVQRIKGIKERSWALPKDIEFREDIIHNQDNPIINDLSKWYSSPFYDY